MTDVSAPIQAPEKRSHTRVYIWTAIGVVALIVGTWLLLRGITDSTGRPLTTLDPRGSQARRIHDLVTPVFVVAGIIFILVEGAILFILLRFRRRREDRDGDAGEPVQLHGNVRAEIAWTLVPAAVLAVLAVFNVRTIWALERDTNDATMMISVRGQQWWWEFRYDVDEDGEVDIITANQLVMPVGQKVRVEIGSNDVIHSFWIPALNGKQDAVPGFRHSIALEADKPGIYEGQCTEYCGLSHGYMRMQVKALSTEDYETWVANQLTPPTRPPRGTKAGAGFEVWKQKCASCHQINGFDPKGEPTGSSKPDPDYGAPDFPLTAGTAPNLTHLMTRDKFAGGMFNLYDRYEPGRGPETALPRGVPNEGDLGKWLHDPGFMKPMDPNNNQGMPNLGLSSDEIEKLIAFLTTLK